MSYNNCRRKSKKVKVGSIFVGGDAPLTVQSMTNVSSSDFSLLFKQIKELEEAVKPDSVTVDDGIALVAVVGRGMRNAKGTAARVFKAIAEKDINIRMIDQGSSELNIIIGVNDAEFQSAINAIYHEFVK